MMDPRVLTTPTMSIDIHMQSRRPRNPMDLSSLLNPLQTPPASESEEEEEGFRSSYQSSPSTHYTDYSLPQPMEVDGEVSKNTAWLYYESSHESLPSINMEAKSPYRTSLPYRPTSAAQSLRMAQVASRRSEKSLVRSGAHSPTHCPRLAPCHDRSLRSPSMKSDSSHDMGEAAQSGKKKKRKSSGYKPNNKAYTQEQVHWMRYQKDCGLTYAELHRSWHRQFPWDPRTLGQSFSSRGYRDNFTAMVDDDDNLLLDENGDVKIIVCPVRKRNDPKYRDIPVTLWEKHPEWALYWDWVRPEHKALAQKIIDGVDLDEAQLRKEKSRRAMRKYEATLPARKGWYATPALHAAAVRESKLKQESTKPTLPPSPVWHSPVFKMETEQTLQWA